MALSVLYWGDSPTVHTGFGTVSKNILNRLVKKGHQITVLGINHYGEPYDQREFPYPIYPCEQGSQERIFGFSKFWWLVDKVKPDIVFFLNDFWLIDQMMEAMPASIDRSKFKIVAYFPVDSGPMKPRWAETLRDKIDIQVCYTHYAEGLVAEANGGKTPKNLRQIYHGVDTSIYKPLNQSQTREELGLPRDAFIVGMVARNQFRKRFDLLMRAFDIFAKDKPEAKLYLHTAVKDIGYDISDLSKQFDFRDRLILTSEVSAAHGVPEEYLNKIYNTFDVNCTISLGDGFSLPTAESMATGCPQLVSGHSALKELVEGSDGGLTVKTISWILNTSGINTWGGVSDVDDIVEKLNVLYKDKELRVRLSQNGHSFISQDMFNWDHITGQFSDIFKELYHLI